MSYPALFVKIVNMKKLSGCLLFIFITVVSVFAQPEVYPVNWWVGMKNPALQVMLHGDNISSATGFTVSYPGVTLTKITRVKNRNYIFLDLTVSNIAKPGTLGIKVQGIPNLPVINYPLLARRPGKSAAPFPASGTSRTRTSDRR